MRAGFFAGRAVLLNEESDVMPMSPISAPATCWLQRRLIGLESESADFPARGFRIPHMVDAPTHAVAILVLGIGKRHQFLVGHGRQEAKSEHSGRHPH